MFPALLRPTTWRYVAVSTTPTPPAPSRCGGRRRTGPAASARPRRDRGRAGGGGGPGLGALPRGDRRGVSTVAPRRPRRRPPLPPGRPADLDLRLRAARRRLSCRAASIVGAACATSSGACARTEPSSGAGVPRLPRLVIRRRPRSAGARCGPVGGAAHGAGRHQGCWARPMRSARPASASASRTSGHCSGSQYRSSAFCSFFSRRPRAV